MLHYKIISKSNPSIVLMHITCDDFEASKKRQLFLLAHKMHPEPAMQTHMYKHGISDFDFIPDLPIEKAIIIPQKETRKRKV
jgi:hypothetical protein